MKLNGKSRLSFAIVMIVCVSSSAATRHVPAEYLTIQSAIDDCNNGDTVIVAAGAYNERIDYSGKNIVVTSEHPDDPATVATTIIDAGGTGSAVAFTNGETQDALLTGFTITGGYGTADPFDEGVFYGGGILCAESSPTITKNVIVNNRGPAIAEPQVISYGGGIGCFGSNAVITNNIIKNNAAYAGAGVMMSEGNARVADNVIYGNSAAIGGGVLLLESGRLLNNTIASNDANREIPGVASNVHVEGSGLGQLQIVNNIICDAKSGCGLFTVGTGEIVIAFNDVWSNTGGNYGSMDLQTRELTFDGATDRTGTDGNISQDPLFAHSEAGDYHLLPDSPCISAGDPTFIAASGQTDIDGEDRVYAVRVDIGADEFVGPVRLVAHAGADQYVDRRQPITLDGSGSFFRNPYAVNAYAWTQVGGPTVELSDANAAQPMFVAELTGDYRFELVISDGAGISEPDDVLITVVNQRPIADAGDDQTFQVVVGEVLLDGIGSYDPTDDALTYRWTQVSGPAVELSDPNAAETSFSPNETGVYVFSLVVSDDLADSEADTVGIVLGNTAPLAHAGSSRYAGPDPVVLDGTRSYNPDGYGVLSYQWTQVSGPIVSITDANTATPTVGSFVQTSSIWECEFQLIVSDGDLLSRPDTVEVIIVPSFGSTVLQLENPPFDPNKPTFIFFAGGNGGGGLGAGPPWEERANMISFETRHYGRMWSEHGNAIIVYLSSVAPDYKQRIQTFGHSKGARLPIVVGAYINTTYADGRYNVNHATVSDGPNPVLPEIPDFLNSSVGGEQSWVDNYRAGPYSAYPGKVIDGALTVYFPPGDHSTPALWYLYSIDPDAVGWIGDVYNNGVTAGPYYSVIGPGKNLELAPHSDSLRYYFEWDAPAFGPGSLEFYDESLYPGRLPELPTLVGPADGDMVDANGALFSCEVSENVVGYQLLFGPDPYQVMDYYIVSDTSIPPSEVITSSPFEQTFWTVKAYDQYGSTIYADPIRVNFEKIDPPLIENITTGQIYASVRHAVSDARNGHEILVNPGVYQGNINFRGKNLMLRSTDPNDPAVVASTILTGNGNGNLITFSNNEDTSCVLSGFTITNANNGIYCYGSSPTITNCSIIGNVSNGIKLYMGSNPAVSNCIIVGNSDSAVAMLKFTAGRVSYFNSPTITNCTIVDNSNIGISEGIPSILNSIIYGNGVQIAGSSAVVTYSNIQGGFPGEGNIDANPLFVDSANGEFHLLTGSPCIDTGDPTSSVGLEPEPNGGIINMGAYGGTSEASKSP
ncbi:MAG: hypothetical protein GY774_12650 [Planctomycetes bacterium]|nr:hypothetical protein [Planctomycetota bacterium]